MKLRTIAAAAIIPALFMGITMQAMAEPAPKQKAKSAQKRQPRRAAGQIKAKPGETDKIARQAREISRWLREHPALAKRIIRNLQQARKVQAQRAAPGRKAARPMPRAKAAPPRRRPGPAFGLRWPMTPGPLGMRYGAQRIAQSGYGRASAWRRGRQMPYRGADRPGLPGGQVGARFRKFAERLGQGCKLTERIELLEVRIGRLEQFAKKLKPQQRQPQRRRPMIRQRQRRSRFGWR